MNVIRHLNEWQEIRPSLHAKTIGIVPTMGYLHEGHMSLVQHAKKETEIVVLTIFVNPLQFGPNEDYEQYPRHLERDVALAKKHGVDYVLAPSVQEMYPTPIKTTVHVDGITDVLCGATRPGHFDGVATVVSKLFHIVQPNLAYFGLKDAQQVVVIQQMVQDLNMPVQIRPCPTEREADGLAISSRNAYLTDEERKQARILYDTLCWAKCEVEQNKRQDWSQLTEEMTKRVESMPLAKADYCQIRSFPELNAKPVQGDILLALAVYIGKTRLIDNMIVQHPQESGRR